MVPSSVMNPIIKPWPFRGWGVDMIDKINPPSSKGHQYILTITDYFTKWVEAIPMKSVTSKDVINFQRAFYSQVWDSSDHHDRWRIGVHI
jgi:hypothetical protein